MVELIIAIYLILVLINMILIRTCHLFDEEIDFGFTVLYLILSPFTINTSIGQAMITSYTKKAEYHHLIETFRKGLENTPYHNMLPEDLDKVMQYLSENTSINGMEYETFEELFNVLVDRDVLYLYNGRYYFNDKI